MILAEMKKALSEKTLDNEFSVVYTPSQYAEQYERYLEVLAAFEELFGSDRDVALFSAPGRSEVGGNHTDHNYGKVLAAGISLDAIAVASKNDEGIIRIKSKGYNMDTVDCSDLSIVEAQIGKSCSLIRGIADRFTQLGYKVGGFEATTASKVL